MNLVEEHSDGMLAIHTNVDRRREGRTCVNAGLLLAVVLVVVAIAADFTVLWWLVLPPVLLIVFGGLYAQADRTFLLDPVRRALVSAGDELPFSSISAIFMSSRVEVVRRQHWDHKKLRFDLALYVDDGETECGATLRELRDEVDALLRAPKGRARQDPYRGAREHHTLRKNRLLGVVDSAMDLLPVASHGNEALVWRSSKQLAKLMDVPIVDICGGRMELRSPGELDLSLRDRLAFGLDVAEPPGSTARGLEVEHDDDSLRIGWHEGLWPHASPPLLVISMFVVTGSILQLILGGWIGPIVISLAVPFAFLLPTYLRRVGKYELVMGKDQISVRSGVGWTQLRTVALDDLESLRVNSKHHPSLNLISDTQIVRLAMVEEQAVWLRTMIEHQLARQVGAEG